jgi:hypothetical protein
MTYKDKKAAKAAFLHVALRRDGFPRIRHFPTRYRPLLATQTKTRSPPAPPPPPVPRAKVGVVDPATQITATTTAPAINPLTISHLPRAVLFAQADH